MKKIQMKKLRVILMRFSLQERREARYHKSKEELDKLRELPLEKLELEYTLVKSKYEYKKNLLLLCLITILITVLTDLWGVFREFISQMLASVKNTNNVMEIITINFWISFIIMSFFVFITFLFLINYMRNIYRIYERLLLIEMVRGEKVV